MSDSKRTLPPAPTGRSSHRAGQDKLNDAEPPLTDVLADPIVHILMERDGAEMAALRALIGETRKRLGSTRRNRTERRNPEVRPKSGGDSDVGQSLYLRRKDDLPAGNIPDARFTDTETKTR